MQNPEDSDMQGHLRKTQPPVFYYKGVVLVYECE